MCPHTHTHTHTHADTHAPCKYHPAHTCTDSQNSISGMCMSAGTLYLTPDEYKAIENKWISYRECPATNRQSVACSDVMPTCNMHITAGASVLDTRVFAVINLPSDKVDCVVKSLWYVRPSALGTCVRHAHLPGPLPVYVSLSLNYGASKHALYFECVNCRKYAQYNS
jgi:hypothetical protein